MWNNRPVDDVKFSLRCIVTYRIRTKYYYTRNRKGNHTTVKILFQTHIRLNITGTCGFVLQISARHSIYISAIIICVVL